MVNLNGMTYCSPPPSPPTPNTANLLQSIYTAPAGTFRDIVSGTNGFSCAAGWDFVTGWGAPLGPGL
jgi:hypothetical protein